MTDRLRFTPRPMHSDFDFIPQDKVIPLLRPAPPTATPTRNVTVRPYTLPDVLAELGDVRGWMRTSRELPDREDASPADETPSRRALRAFNERRAAEKAEREAVLDTVLGRPVK